MQTVFKIQLPRSSTPREGKPFVPRKAHQKSRGGCLGCKRRRIKCDESKPGCGKCEKTKARCIYPPSSSSSSPKTLWLDEHDPVSPKADMYSMSVDLLETDLNHLLLLHDDSGHRLQPVGSVRMLQHFQAFTSLSIGSDICKLVMHDFVAKEAWLHPHLMHMTLAVSAAHLKRLHFESDQIELCQQYKLAEAKYWEQGLKNHRQALSLTKPDFDATLATTFLTIIFSFSLDDEVPLDAFTSNDEEKLAAALDPLSATLGFRALQQFFGDFLKDSVWRPVLLSADNEQGNFSDGARPGIDGLPAAFVDLCELDEYSTNGNNDYHILLRLLTPLLRLGPSVDNFTALMAFTGRTWPHLRPLAQRKDPRALLLLSYWFALARQIPQWWMMKRAKSECMAIVKYLSELNDPKINALLPFPASFGQADLSYIWEPLKPEIANADVSVLFAKYFDKGVKQSSSTLPSPLSVTIPWR